MPERRGRETATDCRATRGIFIKSEKGKERAVTPDFVKEEKSLRRRRLLKDVIQTATALVVTVAAGKWAFAYAYAERGYHSVGGEILVPVLAYLFTYYSVGILLNILEDKRRMDRKKQITPAAHKKEA